MDLFAYLQIEDIGKIAAQNGIDIPRLRGYRLMSEEKVISEEEIKETIRQNEIEECERLLRSVPRFQYNAGVTQYNDRTDYLVRKYLVKEKATGIDCCRNEFTYDKTVGFRWDLIHGKNRKKLKFALKKARRAVRRQLETFNKYAGRNDVLYVHARIGGFNWIPYGGDEIARKEWFLEKVDDYFDDTYCDIYVKIN